MHIDENNAEEIFNMLDSGLETTSLRLHLTLAQAAHSGLTQFVVIGRAISTFTSFPWAKIEQLTGEITKYHAAAVLIGGNRYYGFKKDLGAAKPTNYKNLGWVAKE